MSVQIEPREMQKLSPVMSLTSDIPSLKQENGSPNAPLASDAAIGTLRRMDGAGKFGETLRQEREFRGITLEAITRVTKISNRHLQALEHENFDVLPGGVFNKSMVREYARVVGLDQEEWVGRYLSAHRLTGTQADENGWMRFAENASKARGSGAGNRPEQRLRWAGIAVLLILVAGLGWFVWTYVHKKISLGPITPAHVTEALNKTRPAGYLQPPKR